jgi:AraC family transcriptional regulator
MSLMQAEGQGDPKYPPSTLLKSSNDLGWSTLFAELRSHSNRCEGLGWPVAPHVQIGIPVRGSDEGLVTCKVAGSWRSGRPSIWLKPIGGKYDEIRISSPELQAIYLYMPTVAFARLMDDYNLPAVPGRSVRYSFGAQDELINQIGLSVLSEMRCPTAAGRMLVETSSLRSSAAPCRGRLRFGRSSRRCQ